MSALYGFWHGMIAHLWQTTLVVALILAVERTFRGAPSRAIHALWSIALAKMFLPVFLFGAAANALYAAVARPSAGGAKPSIPTIEPVSAVLFPLSGTGTPQDGSAALRVLMAATACWSAVALFFLSRIALDVIRARRHGGVPVDSLGGAARERLAGILDSAGIPAGSVQVSSEFVMPTVSGLLRPRIVIPEYLLRELPEEELRAILIHEDTHRRRRDPLVTAAGRAALALFFFYPPIYPLIRRLRATAEFACDERVVHTGVSALAYSRALARTLELGLAAPAFATAAAAESSLLRRRLKRLASLNPRRYAMRLQYRALIVFAGLLVVAATLYPEPMQAGPDQQKAAPAKDAAKEQAAVKRIESTVTIKEMTSPVYPEELRLEGFTSDMVLTFKLDKNGAVLSATADSIAVLNADGEPIGELVGKNEAKRISAMFVASAIDASKKWVFTVEHADGKPDTLKVKVPVKFRLHG